MIKRNSLQYTANLAHYFPIVAVTGPRQSGKTTLAREAFPNHQYFSLENPDQLAEVLRDPRKFIRECGTGAIIDEAQRAPELFSYLQQVVDDSKIMGQFVLTGSQQFHLRSNITQSLAGRVAQVELMPFSLGELYAATPPTRPPLEEVLMRGFYPPIHDRNIPSQIWLSQYVSTYVERDVRQLINIKDLNTFRTFVKLAAGRSGQPLNMQSLGNDAGVSQPTVSEWLSVMEASYLISRMQPYHTNFSKRLIKAPKLYFLDVGLLCYLLEIKTIEELKVHPLKGAVFETLIMNELFKHIKHSNGTQKLYFWRDHRGEEVDFVIDHSSLRQTLIECKAGLTLSQSFFAQLLKMAAIFKGKSP
jgi:uncharacterized protein